MPAELYDYVIIGAGTAGCVLAARLSEDPHIEVLLVEAGGNNAGMISNVPLLTVLASADSRRNWSFETEPIPSLHDRRQVWNQGRGLGGSSSINGMIYLRGSPAEYDGWRAAGGAAWSFDALLPFFKKSESNSRGPGPWHGGAGPIKVRPSRLSLPICDAFLDAVVAEGFPLAEDLNAGLSEGFGRFDCNINEGVRSSAAREYLKPARGRKNLTVLTRTLARAVLIERGRASAVELLKHPQPQICTVRARREILICAGALNSPALLMRSGVGPAQHLKELGIPVNLDAPEVGKNLRNHPSFIQQYHCTAPVSAYAYLSPPAGARAVMDYALHRTGPFAESFSSIGGLLRSGPDAAHADTLVVMGPSLLQRARGSHTRWRDLLPKEHGFFIATSLGTPYSAGEIRLRSREPDTAPRIIPNLFSDPRDLPALARSVRAVSRAMRRDCIARYIDLQRDRENFSDDLSEISHQIRAAAGSLSHPTGTCRMGLDPNAVVDPEMRVRGVAGLRVADNSIIPVPLNAGTHAAALMIGEKAAALLTAADT